MMVRPRPRLGVSVRAQGWHLSGSLDGDNWSPLHAGCVDCHPCHLVVMLMDCCCRSCDVFHTKPHGTALFAVEPHASPYRFIRMQQTCSVTNTSSMYVCRIEFYGKFSQLLEADVIDRGGPAGSPTSGAPLSLLA